MALEQFAQLRHHLAKDDRPLEFISTPAYNQPQVSDKSMCQLTNEHPGAHWVLHQCPEHLQKWFAGQSIRATLLGSPFSGIDLPSIDIDFRSASRHAAGSLLSLDHRRLCLIRFRSHLAGDDLALNGIADALAHHHDCPAPIVLSQNFHVDNLTSMLDRLYARPTPPTGIIVVNHHHFITAYSHLLSKGIQIPNQVSIVCLTHDTLMDRLSPRPTTYSVGDRLIKKLAQMVLNPSSTNQGSRIQLIPEMQAGKTICRHSASTNE